MRGCLVISSTDGAESSLKEFFHALFSDSEVFSGNILTDKFKEGIATDIPLVNGAFALSDDKFYSIPIPTRASSIVTCFNGSLANFQEILEFTEEKESSYVNNEAYAAGLLLSKLNSDKHGGKEAEENYADKVYTRVIEKLHGTFAMTLAYLTLSARNKIIIASKERDIYFHLVHNEHFYALVWTDELQVFDYFSHDFFVYSMTPLYEKNLLVLHPLYLMDKWKKWHSRNNGGSGPLMAVSIFEKYLLRGCR